ncbi:MAG: transcriptional regulator, partial [Actinobacteria bacterium]|nr:transcriptional regulator [Actinomycetota bacterium]
QPDGVPFVQDKIRDSEGMRESMTREFEDVLISTGRAWVALDGSVAQRVELTLQALDEAMATAFEFNEA